MSDLTCWNCGYDRYEEWRYCPNCGLWLMNAAPMEILRSRLFTIVSDDRTPLKREPDFRV